MNRCIMIVMASLLLLAVSAPMLAQESGGEPDLVFGALPVSHLFPFYVALSQGFFEEEGVTVQLVPFGNARALREAMIAGEVEGFQSDLVSALLINDAGVEARVVRHLELTDHPFFAIVTAGPNAIGGLEEIRGAQIAISAGTVVEYLTDQLLLGAGIGLDEVEYLDSPSILNRGISLLAGEINVIVVPQPFVEMALQVGGRILIDDSVVDYVPEAIGFTAATLAEKGDAVRAMLAAYERAVAIYNAADEDFSLRDVISEEVRINVLRAAYATQLDAAAEADPMMAAVGDMVFGFVPDYGLASVPSAEDYAAVHDWALAKGLISQAFDYADIVDGGYLPEAMADDEMADDAADESDGDE